MPGGSTSLPVLMSSGKPRTALTIGPQGSPVAIDVTGWLAGLSPVAVVENLPSTFERADQPTSNLRGHDSAHEAQDLQRPTLFSQPRREAWLRPW
jgi:hypothetical protein